MAGETVLSDINGVTKRVYDNTIKKALPGSSWLQQRVSWDKGSRQVGESYQVAVVLRPPNGFTHVGSGGGTATLKQGRPMQIKQASITPFEFELRENLTFVAMSRAKEQGEGAMANLVGEYMKAMKFSASNRLEANILHGQRSLGTVTAVTDLGGGQADLTISEATWAPGMWWALNEGTTLDAFTSTTKNNASGPLVVKGIKASDRKLTVEYTGTLANEVAADDVLRFEGAWDGTSDYEMPGLIAQGSNTSGTSLGLSATTYSNWKGNTHDVGGNISTDVIETMIGMLRDRGATGKLSALMSNRAFGVIMGEVKSQRVFDSSYSSEKAKVGAKAVSMVSPDVGEVELVNHPFMKWGEILIIDAEDCGRVGSADLTFGLPGNSVDAPVWEKVTGTNYAEIILFTDQACILKAPNHALLGTGITYS
jgi:hypothetical protein